MQPSPSADTSNPLFPSVRVFNVILGDSSPGGAEASRGGTIHASGT